MRCKVIALVLMMVAVAGRPLSAQAGRLGPAPSVLFQPAREFPADSIHYHATYWKEGALLLGIPMAVLSADVVYQLCKDPDSGTQPKHCGANALGGAVVGFVIGAVPGALIGALIPKHE